MKQTLAEMAEQKQEMIQSAISYGGGSGLIGLATLADVANMAQAVGLILGCVVIAIRAIHDAINLYRFIKKK